jgi:ESCRT-II complex subunit VPS36
MSYIRQTEFYVGFMRSSPKITLSLGLNPTSIDQQSSVNPDEGTSEQGEDWSCPVCGHGNPTGHTGVPRPEDKCGLCGVTYGKSSAMGPNGRATPLSTSRPSTPKPDPPPISSSATPPPEVESRSTPCPACTFLNHPSIRNCEICDTVLPRPLARQATSTSTSISTAVPSPVLDSGRNDTIRLSFRKGGSSECYRRLKNVLSDKAWESKVIHQSNGRNGDSTPRGAGIGKFPRLLSGYIELTVTRWYHAVDVTRCKDQGR